MQCTQNTAEIKKRKDWPHAVSPIINQQCSLIFKRKSLLPSTLLGRAGFSRRAGIEKNITKNQPRAVGLMINQQCSIFPARYQASIFDDEKLNFCVRDGNRWNLLSISTGYGIIAYFYGIIKLIWILLYLRKRRIGITIFNQSKFSDNYILWRKLNTYKSVIKPSTY